MKISVIVPIYNKEKELSKTIESLLNQTHSETEILLINDGSTDDSQQRIDNYVKKYPDKIKSYQKENGGLSDARNYGVSKATGEYLCFVDAGDFLNKELFFNLFCYMKQNIELIKYKMIKVDEQEEKIEKVEGPTFEVCTGEEAFEKLYAKDSFMEVACIYLYQRKFWIKNHFSYQKDTYHEDFGLTPIVLTKAKTVVSTSEYGYYYVQDDDSITRHKNYLKTVKQAQDILFHYDNILKQLPEMKASQKTKESLRSYYANAVLLKTKELKGIEQKKYIQEIKQRKLYTNIIVTNFRQWIKKILLRMNIKWYLIFK